MVATRSAARAQKAAPPPDDPKPTLKAPPKRKTTVTKKAAATKKADAVQEQPPAVSKKATATKKSTAATKKPVTSIEKTAYIPVPAPMVTKRTTRATAKKAPPNSPIKKPARKPAAAKPVATKPVAAKPTATKSAAKRASQKQGNPEHVHEELFADFPNYPTTPAHIIAPKPATPINENPLAEFPRYPTTPAYIAAPKPVSPVEENPLASFPNYPTTPAHLAVSKSTASAEENPLAEFPNYPKTPMHIVAPTAIYENPLAEFPNYPNTPTHIIAPNAVNKHTLTEPPSYQSTPTYTTIPVQIEELVQMEELAQIEELTQEVVADIASDVDVNMESIDTVEQELSLSRLPDISLPALMSEVKSAMRSPLKLDAKTPKKTVTWNASPYTSLDTSCLVQDGPLHGTVFYLDIRSYGRVQNHLFVDQLEDLGAVVVPEWSGDATRITHVLFKEGSAETLERVAATRGTVKCVNVGFSIDCERHNKRMDEDDYLIDLNPANLPAPTPRKPIFTPARTPSRFFKFSPDEPSSIIDIPATPTSSEWERSIIYPDDKENTVPSHVDKLVQQSCPPKSRSSLLSEDAYSFLRASPLRKARESLERAEIMKESFLKQSPIKPAHRLPLTCMPARKRKADFGGFTLAPPKKLRFN